MRSTQKARILVCVITFFSAGANAAWPGNQVWVMRYDNGFGDAAHTIDLDASGSVYVAGHSMSSSTAYDFATIKAMTAPLMETGEKFLPGFLVLFLSLGALSAGLTSFNAGAIALPRELFSQARDGIAPAFLGKIHERTRSPLNAVATFFLLTVLMIILGQEIEFYGVMASVGILLMTVVIAIAALRLPSQFPERTARAYFRLSRPWLIAVVITAVLSSLGFAFIVLAEVPRAGVIYVGWTILVIVYYHLRVRWLKKNGFPWDETISRLPGFDEE